MTRLPLVLSRPNGWILLIPMGWLLTGLVVNPDRLRFLILLSILVPSAIVLRRRFPHSQLILNGMGVVAAFVCYQAGSVFRFSVPVGNDSSLQIAIVPTTLLIAAATLVFRRNTRFFPYVLILYTFAILAGTLVLIAVMTTLLRPMYSINPIPLILGILARTGEAVLVTIVGAEIGQILCPESSSQSRSKAVSPLRVGRA